MTDTDHKRMLEMAAKAAGIRVCWHGSESCARNMDLTDPPRIYWNPLTDDGDALRLSVALLMELDHNHPADPRPWVSVGIPGTRHCVVEDFDDECQRLAATRAAITRAAAAIGEQMP